MLKILPLLALTMAGCLALAGCGKKDEITTTVADSAVASGAAFDTRVNPAPVETVGRPPVGLPPPAQPVVTPPADAATAPAPSTLTPAAAPPR